MKKALLLLTLLGLAGSAQAQLTNLLTATRLAVNAGVNAGVESHRRNNDARSDATIALAYYRKQPYPQKRTPANKLKGPGADQIAYQESLLDKCRAALIADSTTNLGAGDMWNLLQSSRELIARYRPAWNTQAYADEAAFYQAEDVRRKQLAPPAR